MGNPTVRVEFTEDEAKAIIEILRYSLDYCPIEGVSYEGRIVTRDEVENLIKKLEGAPRE